MSRSDETRRLRRHRYAAGTPAYAPRTPPPQTGDADQFRVTSDPTVRIAVYDTARTLRASAEGSLQLALPPGLYRVHFERGGAVHHEIVDHERTTELAHPGPPLCSPVPFTGAETSRDYYVAAARRFSVEDTGSPLGRGPATGRLFVFLRRASHDAPPRQLPSEPIAIHDAHGHRLAVISEANARIDLRHGYVACSLRVAPGTYRLRAMRSRRSIALTIPGGRAAQVFVADAGVVRLDELRVALAPVDVPFDPDRAIWRAMESVLAALRAHDLPLPLAARALLPEAADDDLCFAIAAAHVLWRSNDRAGLTAVMQRLAPHAALPDVAILEHLHRFDPRSPIPEAPPLLRASLTAAMSRPELTRDLPADSVIAEAARTRLHDSVWCTWTARPWDERWIEPTVARLAAQSPRPDAIALARSLALPVRTIQRTLDEIAAAAACPRGPSRNGPDFVPGYAIAGVLGRGAYSTVYRATRLDDHRDVALKVLASTSGSAHPQRQRERAGRARHPGIVAPTACGSLPHDPGVWFEMELCRGSVLDMLADADAPLAIPDACRLALDALRGVSHLHRRGIVHGHLTPANVLIRNNGSAAIPDVALATPWASARAQRRSVLAQFVAPELLLDAGAPEPPGDVWSMAATLYFMLTLESPRAVYAGQDARSAARDNPIEPLATYRDDIPPELAACIERALSPACEVRPMNACAFYSCLRWITAPDVRVWDSCDPAPGGPLDRDPGREPGCKPG
jgi:Protein kinase domain